MPSVRIGPGDDISRLGEDGSTKSEDAVSEAAFPEQPERPTLSSLPPELQFRTLQYLDDPRPLAATNTSWRDAEIDSNVRRRLADNPHDRELANQQYRALGSVPDDNVSRTVSHMTMRGLDTTKLKDVIGLALNSSMEERPYAVGALDFGALSDTHRNAVFASIKEMKPDDQEIALAGLSKVTRAGPKTSSFARMSGTDQERWAQLAKQLPEDTRSQLFGTAFLGRSGDDNFEKLKEPARTTIASSVEAMKHQGPFAHLLAAPE